MTWPILYYRREAQVFIADRISRTLWRFFFNSYRERRPQEVTSGCWPILAINHSNYLGSITVDG